MNKSKQQVKITIAEAKYLLDLIYNNEDEGSYWGNKQQFIKRRNDIKTKLEERL